MRKIVDTRFSAAISRGREKAWEGAYRMGKPQAPALHCASAPPADTRLSTPALPPAEALTKAHARRLRAIYRSAGWPSQDPMEIDLLAAGMLERLRGTDGHETLRVTDSGVRWLAATLARNRAALSAHEALVEQVATEMCRSGRLAWRGISLRAQVPTGDAVKPLRWCIARPDVFSIRHTSVESYVEPIVHEIKVRRSDLLADLRQEAKRASYLDLGECWYVLGQDARGRAIGEPDEVPTECGVLIAQGTRLAVARPAKRRTRASLPFGVWIALARATPVAGLDEDVQGELGAGE